MRRRLALVFMVSTTAPVFCVGQAEVRVVPSHLQGPRQLEEQTQSAVIRDYQQAWQTFRTSLDRNDAGLLDKDFVGTARDKLVDTVHQQSALGIHTRYQDRSHNIEIVSYSPEGLSIELTDDVEYDVQIFDHDKLQTTQQVCAHYIAVLTPAEVRWRVRVFQAQPE